MACKVHKVRFYNPKPQAINCITYNRNTKLIAVARENASIEIWDVHSTPVLVKFIPGVVNGSIEALGWVKDRLLSTGLAGALVEWDLNSLSIKKSLILTGYAAWCLDVSSDNSLIAVGTEQGFINLYSVIDSEIVYNKIFDKQEGRILCCKFNNLGDMLVTGSVDTIRVWNVNKGHATIKMSSRRRGKETIVWCLGVLSDNTLVSGESSGRLSFWDLSTGDQIESHTTHKADILSIVVSEDERSLYCSGIDPVIVNFIKVEDTKRRQQDKKSMWVKNVQRHIHEHDVRGLVLHNEKLVSVGADGYMTLSSYPPKWVMRIPPLLPGPRSFVSPTNKLILLKYFNHMEVWKLGGYTINKSGKLLFTDNSSTQAPNNKSTNNKIEQDSDLITTDKETHDQGLKVTENPMKLISIRTKEQKQLRCCEMSSDGQYIVYATDSQIRMLKISVDEDINNTCVSKVQISGITSPSCDRVTFASDSSAVFLHCAGEIHVLQLDPDVGASLQQTIKTDKCLKSNTLLHLQVSAKCESGRSYLVAADTVGGISVWSRSNRVKFETYLSLPTYHCVPSAITIHQAKESVVVVYVDQKIVQYDLVRRKFEERLQRCLPAEWFDRQAAVTRVLTHPNKENALVFHDQTSLWILDDNQGTITPNEKRKKNNKNQEQSNASLKIVPIKYLSEFHWLTEEEAVVVQVLPENIVSQLPPVLYTKRFS